MKNFYTTSLANLKAKNLYRKPIATDAIDGVCVRRAGKKLISFSSNDYFNLSQNLQVKNAAIAAIKKFGVGAGASRYVSGSNSLYAKLEKQIAKMKNCDDAIIFSSGYAAAIGVLPALVGAGDLILADRLIHSCLIDGAKLSGARLIRFLHNDIAQAAEILAQNRSKFKKCLIITESVFSMDGNLGKVGELLALAKKFDCLLLSDCAHDLFLSCDLSDENHLKMGTFSKAVGALGGYVAGDALLIDYLRNFAKSQIYSTALPPAILAASFAALKIIAKKNLGVAALENAKYFCQLMNLPKPQSAIVPIILHDNKKVLNAAKKLKQKGFLVSAIRPPTVEIGKARLRFTFSSAHKKKQIAELARVVLL